MFALVSFLDSTGGDDIRFTLEYMPRTNSVQESGIGTGTGTAGLDNPLSLVRRLLNENEIENEIEIEESDWVKISRWLFVGGSHKSITRNEKTPEKLDLFMIDAGTGLYNFPVNFNTDDTNIAGNTSLIIDETENPTAHSSNSSRLYFDIFATASTTSAVVRNLFDFSDRDFDTFIKRLATT